MARGDGGKRIFTCREDHESFLHGLERVCLSHGWRVHAWVEKFKDKLLGLIDKAGAKAMKRGSIAGAAVRARGEKEAERIIQAVGSKLGLPGSAEELQALRKGDPRKVICAARVKGNTSMSNDWLAKRLQMGHPAAMSQLVNRLRKDPAGLKTLKKYEKTFKSKD